MTEATKGVLAALCGCILWGGTGLFYDLMVHIPALEIFAHRTLWAVVIFAAILWVQGKWRAPLRALAQRESIAVIALASLMIAANYLIFVIAVQSGKALEASLGYFLFPLVAVFLGRVAFGEHLNTGQIIAVGVAATAVLLLTIGLGVAPWIALMLGTSAGFYGLIKKRLDMAPTVSVTAETVLILPLCLAGLVWIARGGEGHFGAGWQDSLLLILSGPLTVLPLILFSYAATRISLASLGTLNYLNPSLQFLAATLILHEPFGIWHAIAFAMIWSALVIYSVAAWRQDRAVRRAFVKSGTVPTTRM